MLNIEDLMSGDFSAYPEEVRSYLESFSERLKECLIEELVSHITNKILKSIEGGREEYMTILTEMLENGHKGYNNMSMRNLLNIYLEKKNEEDFLKLLEKAAGELEEKGGN